MKILKLILPFVLSTVAVFAQQKTISISNASTLDRKQAVVSIPWSSIVKVYPEIDTLNFKIVDRNSRNEIPFQIEHRGKADIQNLLIQVSVPAKKTVQLNIEAGKPLPVTVKTFARYVPERKDDFAWENDKIAFRMYGKALEKTSEDAYGIDVWVKNTPKMVVDERYRKNDYHKDHGDGLDYYSVGFTLGAGSMAPFVKDSVRYSGNYRSSKVLDNGPLRSTFQLTYDSWNAAGIKVKVVKTISIDAGSQLNRIENLYTFSTTGNLPVAIGLATRNEADKKLLLDKNGLLGYWEPIHGNDGITGVGVVDLKPLQAAYNAPKQALGITEVQNNVPYVYYAGAVWNNAGKITDADAWFAYLKNFKQALKFPLKVLVK
ncbi:DUF4861 family protein [Pedobacter sp. AW1-32]|uniref:DUF4861 family protein n=1 Tax=Pedobacter sp. AW1-32 TaxID=3383026 RepID=UPI003FF0B4DD